MFYTDSRCMYHDDIVAGQAATTGKQAVHVLIFCSLHHFRVVFHTQSLYRCHHRQLQRQQTTGYLRLLYIRVSLTHANPFTRTRHPAQLLFTRNQWRL